MKSFNMLRLETKRLVLSPLAMSDKDELFAIHADKEVMKYWSSGPWQEIAKADEMIKKDLEHLKEGKHLRLGLRTKESQRLIGTASLFSFSEQCRRAEIGYVLARSHWGGGFMSEALTALIDFGFKELDLIRLEADVDPRNLSSAKILERLGFIKEGHLRDRWIIEGEVLDSSFYGLLRQEWKSGT